MMRPMMMISAAFFVLAAQPALASTYVFEARGVVASAYSADRDFKQVPNPPSTIAVGDSFSIKFDLDPAGATPGSYYDADPTINIYYWYVSNLTLTAGSFTSSPVPGERTFASFQLWNDHLSAGSSVDYFGLSTLRYLPTGASPVDLGAGSINSQFHFNGFDFTGSARQSDLLTELPPLSSYGSRSAFFGFLNGDTYLQTVFQLNLTGASLTAVPEPTTWAMLLLGFGAAGAALRRRPNRARMRIAYR